MIKFVVAAILGLVLAGTAPAAPEPSANPPVALSPAAIVETESSVERGLAAAEKQKPRRVGSVRIPVPDPGTVTLARIAITLNKKAGTPKLSLKKALASNIRVVGGVIGPKKDGRAAKKGRRFRALVMVINIAERALAGQERLLAGEKVTVRVHAPPGRRLVTTSQALRNAFRPNGTVANARKKRRICRDFLFLFREPPASTSGWHQVSRRPAPAVPVHGGRPVVKGATKSWTVHEAIEAACKGVPGITSEFLDAISGGTDAGDGEPGGDATFKVSHGPVTESGGVAQTVVCICIEGAPGAAFEATIGGLPPITGKLGTSGKAIVRTNVPAYAKPPLQTYTVKVRVAQVTKQKVIAIDPDAADSACTF